MFGHLLADRPQQAILIGNAGTQVLNSTRHLLRSCRVCLGLLQIIKLARQPSPGWTAHLIRQPTALLLLPALRKSLLLVAKSSRQVNDVMVVSSVSTRTLIE